MFKKENNPTQRIDWQMLLGDVEMKIVMKIRELKISADAKATLWKHWYPTAVFTGSWYSGQEKKMDSAKLLQGELSAKTSTVGCYLVRSAIRVYKIHEPGYCPELEVPADQNDMDLLWQYINEWGNLDDFLAMDAWCAVGRPWSQRLRITHEISARHKDDPNPEFVYITRTAQARNLMWHESINCICTAKENVFVPDRNASLFVCNTYVGDSFSVDTWYQFSRFGKITRLELHPFNSKQDEARFH